MESSTIGNMIINTCTTYDMRVFSEYNNSLIVFVLFVRHPGWNWHVDHYWLVVSVRWLRVSVHWLRDPVHVVRIWLLFGC